MFSLTCPLSISETFLSTKNVDSIFLWITKKIFDRGGKRSGVVNESNYRVKNSIIFLQRAIVGIPQGYRLEPSMGLFQYRVTMYHFLL